MLFTPFTTGAITSFAPVLRNVRLAEPPFGRLVTVTAARKACMP